MVWESIFETGICSLNDLVTTTIGGAAVVEMLHRLFIELDANGTISGKIGSAFVSPADRLTAPSWGASLPRPRARFTKFPWERVWGGRPQISASGLAPKP